MYFIYGEAELAYLRRKDKRLAAVIDRIGPVERTVDPDLFSAVVHHIIGQQISMKAQATIWQRMQDTLGSVSAETILAAGVPALQALGMTFRKAEYLTDLAGRIVDGSSCFTVTADFTISNKFIGFALHNLLTVSARLPEYTGKKPIDRKIR